jgi:flagellar assembly factor FliW
MIRLEKTRFGTITIDESAEIRFARGLVGFSSENRFVLLERERGPIAYLQSLNTPSLALPVIDARHLQPAYPNATDDLASKAGIGSDDTLVLVVLAIDPLDGSLRANLLAPLVIDAKNRSGAQIILDPEHYGPSVQLGNAPEARETERPISTVRSVDGVVAKVTASLASTG